MRILPTHIKPPEQIQSTTKQPSFKTQSVQPGLSFNQVLESKVLDNTRNETLSFSKHAEERLKERNINFSTDQIKRLEKGVNEARNKGINESLVLLDDVAMVVNVDNNVVITAIHKEEQQVYTNINGAIFC